MHTKELQKAQVECILQKNYVWIFNILLGFPFFIMGFLKFPSVSFQGLQ